MSNTFLLAVDGSTGSDKAAEFATNRAKLGNAKIVVAYVIEWSPYTFNTPEENAERHKRREEELVRAQSVVDPVAAKLKDAGIEAASVVRHGHPAKTLVELADEHGAIQIFIGRQGETGLKSMLFGSVAANLVQSSPVPVTVVP